MTLHVSKSVDEISLDRVADIDKGNYVNASIWSVTEPCMGVISACIPSLRPLVSMLIGGTTRGLGHSNFVKKSTQDSSSSSSRVAWRRRAEDDKDGRFQRLADDGHRAQQWGHDVEVRGGKSPAERGMEDGMNICGGNGCTCWRYQGQGRGGCDE